MKQVLARTVSPEATEALGEVLGAQLRPGDVLGLRGGLGAGKTQLTHGLVKGFRAHLGEAMSGRVCSPSYTIINTYEFTTARVHHMDLYRLTDVDDLESTGYWDALADPDAVVIIEWPRQVDGALPRHGAELVFELENPSDPASSARVLILEGIGDAGLRARLLGAVAGLA